MSDPKANITDLFALAAETQLQITKNPLIPFLENIHNEISCTPWQ